jgi:penicillin-binding protein 2
VVLTIDRRVQQEAEESLKGKTGAVVAIDPNTGEILALASSPSFDPNLFSRGIHYNDWTDLVDNPQRPLLNRAIQSHYPPGSTFKIITAIAALEEGIVNDKTRFQCNGSINVGRVFRCWKEKGHGNLDIHRAIVESCDVFFYEIGKRMDIDTLSRYALDYGLGSPSGIELEGERAGTVPSVEWKLRTKKEKWYMGETLNAVIGQGYLNVTPIQAARFIAAVVNGGRLLEPYLLMKAHDDTRVVGTIKTHKRNIAAVKRALIGVVSDNNGTGRRAYSEIVSIGGKTGTAQVIGKPDKRRSIPDKYKDHAWFVAYAPEESPRIAVAAFIEHGGQGSVAAAPIARRVVEAYYKNRVN